MAIVYSYPLETPVLSDTLLGTRYEQDLGNSVKNFSVLDVINLAVTYLPPGPQGVQGPVGPTGPQGPSGGTGGSGATGPQGPQGVPGPVGPAGLNWQGTWSGASSYSVDDAVGYNGASYYCIVATSSSTPPSINTTEWALLASQGAVGPQGPTGATGAGGSTGTVGPAGPQGIQGLQGTAGTAGATGAAGPTGATGPQGPAGLAGATGSTGATGPQGNVGPIGPSGLNWAGQWTSGGYPYSVNDAVGYNGASWFCINNVSSPVPPNLDTANWALLASQGSPGVAGPAGTQGATGSPGIAGPGGPQGPAGPQGATGAQGPQGIQGVAGVGAGVTSITTIATSGTTNGGTITGSVLQLAPASGTTPGVVNNIAQGFSGVKTFSSRAQMPEIALAQGGSHTPTGGYNTISADSGGYFYYLGNNAFASAYFNFNLINTSQKNFTFPNTTGTVALGGGSPNQLAYWSGTNTLSSLSVAVYPSLAEISYVKGVTSAIQTQLNSKQPTITLTTTGTSGAATFVGNVLNIPQYSGGSTLTLGPTTTPTAFGATLVSNVLRLATANATNAGLMDISNQTFAGLKTFNSNITVNSVEIGRPAIGANNLRIGNSVLASPSGNNNIGIGDNALLYTTSGTYNIAVGIGAAQANLSGGSNIAIGSACLALNQTGSGNLVIGASAGNNITSGNYNTAIGTYAGGTISTGSTSVFLGYNALPNGSNNSNEIVIGAGNIGYGTNTISLGNNSITKLVTWGAIGVNTGYPAASSIMDLTSVSQGFLPPRMTAVQRGNIVSPAVGLMVYQTDGGVNEGLWLNKSSGWVLLT